MENKKAAFNKKKAQLRTTATRVVVNQGSMRSKKADDATDTTTKKAA